MKKILCIILFIVSTLAVAQNKYSYKRGLLFFKKAEKYYCKRDFKKSLFFIEKYEKSRLGYCGNAFIVAKNNINKYKINNYIGLNKYDEALNLINKQEEFSYFEFSKNDSLKIEILFLKYGKDKVKQAFANAENINSKNEKYGIYNYNIKLKDLNFDFDFKVYKNKQSESLFNSTSFKNFYFISFGLPIHKLIFDNNSKQVEFSFVKKDRNNLTVNYTAEVNKDQYDKLPNNHLFLVQDLLEQSAKIINSNTNQHFYSTTNREDKSISQNDFFIKTNIDFENNSPKKFKIEKIIYDQNVIEKTENNISIQFNENDYKTKNLDSEFKKVDFSKIELDEIVSEIYKESPFISLKK